MKRHDIMKVIDTKGRLCPEPLILAKKAFATLNLGEQMEVVSDNDTSCSNLMRFLKDTNANPILTEEGNIFKILCTKGEGALIEKIIAEDYCEIPIKEKISNYVISISSDKMGQGDDELGKILIKAFINTIPEINKLPSTIVFYNAGVLLVQESFGLQEGLINLEQRGIKIIVCGTCVDYFGIKDKINVGQISNMYDIANALVGADKILTP